MTLFLTPVYRAWMASTDNANVEQRIKEEQIHLKIVSLLNANKKLTYVNDSVETWC